MKTVLVVATMDTKGTEAAFLREQIEALGAKALLLDGGITGLPIIEPDIIREEVAAAAGLSMEEIRKIPAEGEALGAMAEGAGALAKDLYQAGKIHGILSIGGGMGTALGTTVMKALPIGAPKVMVSSQASNPNVVGPAVGTSDICMIHSVIDPNGLNRLLRTIYTRACGAVVGMVNTEVKQEASEKKTVSLCTKGGHEATYRKIRQKLNDAGYEPVTFHCFGYGPASLEQLLKEGYIEGGCIEFASDWGERLAGGDTFPPDDRYENSGKLGLPQVYAPLHCDFIAAPPKTERFSGRKFAHHNRNVWLYRSTREELIRVGREMGEKISKSKGPVTILIPMRGFSVWDREGGPLYDPYADEGFLEGIGPFAKGNIKIKKVDANPADADQFADIVIEAFLENAALAKKTKKAE